MTLLVSIKTLKVCNAIIDVKKHTENDEIKIFVNDDEVVSLDCKSLNVKYRASMHDYIKKAVMEILEELLKDVKVFSGWQIPKEEITEIINLTRRIYFVKGIAIDKEEWYKTGVLFRMDPTLPWSFDFIDCGMFDLAFYRIFVDASETRFRVRVVFIHEKTKYLIGFEWEIEK